jgi:hypothetical protein
MSGCHVVLWSVGTYVPLKYQYHLTLVNTVPLTGIQCIL